MRHVTHNTREHFIRRLIVYKNKEEVGSIIIARQASPSYYKADIRVVAEGEDELSIKAICNKGGIGRANIVVPKDEETEEEEKNVKKITAERKNLITIYLLYPVEYFKIKYEKDLMGVCR